MKKTIAILVLLVVGLLAYREGRAQTIAPPITIQSTVAHTSCVLPPTGASAYCFASDGIWQSINAAPFALLVPPASGVSSVTVCNAGGTSCGLPLTGAVSLNVPKSVTLTPGTGTLQ